MERSEAELFAAFEADVSQDVTSSLQRVDDLFVANYNLLCSDKLGLYEELRADSHEDGYFQHLAFKLGRVAFELWSQVASDPIEIMPADRDLLTVSVAANTAYMQYGYNDAIDMLQLEAGQSVSGLLHELTIMQYMPEGSVIPELEEGEMLDRRLVHPLGVHIVLDNCVVDGGNPDGDQPEPGDRIYVPLHYRNIVLTKLGQGE